MLDNIAPPPLTDLAIFENIHEDELAFFRDKFSFMSYIEDDIILNGSAFEQKYCYFLNAGRVRVVRTTPSNNEVSYYDLEAPMGFGFENIFPSETIGKKSANVIVSALTDVHLFVVKQDNFSEVLKDYRILMNFTKYALQSYQMLVSPPETRLNQFRKSA
ncbi:MAG: cyclic nucleotide-binding domain-containing protein [Pseudomonadota bacterium]